MEVVATTPGIRDVISRARSEGMTVGLVPTMGALHAGHMSLVKRCREEADFTVVSIFVNPLQFAPTEDLGSYPRPEAADRQLSEDAGVDLLFRPRVEDMYDRARTVSVTAGALGAGWEGTSRPGHFDGVLTVVAKLFNIVRPDVTVFGRKDLQQSALVSALIRDLSFDMRLIIADIVRESDGLALSSRNRYLSPEERRQAAALSRGLRSACDRYAAGERNVDALEGEALAVIGAEPEVNMDYLGIVDSTTFVRPSKATAGNAVVVAARVGTTRLIDNMILGRNDQD